MPLPDPSKIMTFATPQLLGEWLKAHHAVESELWVKIFKKHTTIESVTWNDLVKEVLCWGWIDGVKKSIDEQAYLQRITPRTARSNWSKRNTEYVEVLVRENRMQEAGLVQVRSAKADGRWDNAYVASEMVIPSDFLEVVDSMPRVKAFFGTLNKTNRYVIAHGLISAKKADTRQRRFNNFLDMLAREEKPT